MSEAWASGTAEAAAGSATSGERAGISPDPRVPAAPATPRPWSSGIRPARRTPPRRRSARWPPDPAQSPSAAGQRPRPGPDRRSRPPRSAARPRGAAAPPEPRPPAGSAPRTPQWAGPADRASRSSPSRPAADPPARATGYGVGGQPGLAQGPGPTRAAARPRCTGSGRSPRKAIRWWPWAIRWLVASCAPLPLATRTVGQDSRRGGRSTNTTGSPRSSSGCRKEWSRRQDMITRLVHRPGQQPVDQIFLAVRVGVGAHGQDQAALLAGDPLDRPVQHRGERVADVLQNQADRRGPAVRAAQRMRGVVAPVAELRAAAANTRSRVSGDAPTSSLITLDTDFRLTPDALATSFMVGRRNLSAIRRVPFRWISRSPAAAADPGGRGPGQPSVTGDGRPQQLHGERVPPARADARSALAV